MSNNSDSHISLVTSRIDGDQDFECKEDVKEVEVPSMDPHTLILTSGRGLLPRSRSFSKPKGSIQQILDADNYFVCPSTNRNPTNPC